jgi:hypothetical protein
MLRQKTSLASLLYLLTACTSHTPGPEVTPSPSQPPSSRGETPTLSPSSSWEFHPSEQNHQYRSTSYVVIREISATQPRADTLRVSTHFTISLNQLLTPIAISGYIDSVTTTQNGVPTFQLNNVLTKPEFTGTATPNQLVLNLSTNQVQCSSPIASILGEIRPVVTTHPRSLSLKSTWTDSVSTVTCSGIGIPTTLKAIRSYRVLGETSYSAIRALVLERTEVSHFSGTGSQQRHQVQIEGEGTGTSRIYLDINNAVTLAVENNQKVETRIKSSGRLQHFVQDITQKIELAR